MTKKICPVCNKKIKDIEECCPKCGYYFSMSTSQIDNYGRPFSDYQESMHEEHYYRPSMDEYIKPDSDFSKNTTSNSSINNDVKPITNYSSTSKTITNSNGETLTTITKTVNGKTTTSTTTSNTGVQLLHFGNQMIMQEIAKNTNTRPINDEELIAQIKKLFTTQGVGSVSGIFFGIFWTMFSMIFVLVGLQEDLFFTLFGGFFVFIGICLIVGSVKAINKKNHLMTFVNKKDWISISNYAGKVGYDQNYTHLLYVGALVAYHRLNDKKLAKNYLSNAIAKNQSTFVLNLKTFAPLVNDLGLTDIIKNINFYTTESND